MENRIEADGFGEIAIPLNRQWGAQTQRSLTNFPIGNEKMPVELIHAYAVVKKAAAITNGSLGLLDKHKADAIAAVCDEIQSGVWDAEFPLSVWQTGSGTQTNMNMNEVIARLASVKTSAEVHPNDDVNKAQSTNDTFPTAMHIAGVLQIRKRLIPSLKNLQHTLAELEDRYQDTVKIGRTHLQDATPVTFGQEVSAWKEMMYQNEQMLKNSLQGLLQLPLGGTAVGTGLNAHEQYASKAVQTISELLNEPFAENPNKFHGLSSKDAFVFAHGAVKALAANAMKMANDIRWLASGPRSGLKEITIPANEAGSSIMPGKVNPTQAEALTMVCVQVMGNDAAVGFAASQGNFELNVFMPVIAYNFLQSVSLLADSLALFDEKCVKGIEVREQEMKKLLDQSLMLVTALSPYIGYDKAAQIAKHAHAHELTLKEAAIQLEILTSEDFDRYVDAKKMI
ncbi:Fumarate hydratase class II [Alkalibacterium sp. AK22]|uniref:class II fumarate hydratase n=1 Tax=Alkalibacterium sp. AK22 TaxID=1229520 RepID=UPI00045203AD|nr:class II fumarate hydratase [Alkalibacterium sp. AK22]EXJ23809.1 Fumarate hydratase class II [Alkalibacterium sp. AK22]